MSNRRERSLNGSVRNTPSPARVNGSLGALNGSSPYNNGSSSSIPSNKSFLNLTTSALSGVFGSQVSLAELNGDVSNSPSRVQTPSGRIQPTPGIEAFDKNGFYNTLNGRVNELMKNNNSNNNNNNNNYDTQNEIKRINSRVNTLSGGRNSPSIPSWGSSNDDDEDENDNSVSSLIVPLSAPTLIIRISLLFAFGVAYGQLSKRLHDNHLVTVHTLDIDHTGAFSLIWGSQGILLGFLLPLFDWLFPEERKRFHGKGGADWSSIVRAVAAFMGVAYGIRKISWTSTFQAAFYWGMVNPCLWFILDATRNGFILSTLVATVGTFCFALIFPDHLPTTSEKLSETYLSVIALIASAFFCCSICFGNLGRRLLSFESRRR